MWGRLGRRQGVSELAERGPNRWRGAPLVLGAVTFSLGLAAFAYLGYFMRPSGDDYCYGAALTQLGFWGGQVASYLGSASVAYHGDRYSLTLFSYLASALGPRAYGIIPGATILLWIVGMSWALHSAFRWLEPKGHRLLPLYTAVVVIFLTIYQAPDRIQSLYWRSAMLPYLMPIVVIWLTMGVILSRPGSRWANVGRVLVAFFLALLAGGFSEVAAVFQLACYTAILAAALLLSRRRAAAGREAVPTLVAAWAGSVLAVVALVMSPFSRALVASASHPSVLTVLLRSFDWGLAFTRETIQGLPLPTAITLIIGVSIGYWYAPQVAARRRGGHVVLLLAGAALILTVVGISLVASVSAAPYYARLQYPEPRAEIQSRHITVLMFLAVGIVVGLFLAGQLSSRRRKARVMVMGLAAVGLLVALYPLHGSRETLHSVAYQRQWAAVWDSRDTDIRNAIAEGEQDVHVRELDHIVPRVAELKPDPQMWYNQCASGYYGARSIAADLEAVE